MRLAAQFLRYVVVGVANTATDFAIVNILAAATGSYSGLPIVLVNTAAAGTVIIQSFLLNKFWTFSTPGGALGIEFPKFVLVNAGAFVLNTAIVYGLTTHAALPLGLTPLLWVNVAKVTGLGANVVWNFLGFKLFVFRAQQ